MAETAGLVLSGIAITTLFTSCVEVLEYFENGRNWICDLGLAQAKVNLMKIRLSQLEDNLHEIADGHATDEGKAGYFVPEVWDWGSPGLGSCDVSGDDWEVSAISRGLSGIGEVLRRTSKLCRRYSYSDTSIREAAKHGQAWHTHSRPQDTAPAAPQPTCRLNHINRRQSEGTSRQVQARQNRVRPSGWELLSKKMSWAVQDKKRFDALIEDFDFLLSNLEKVAGGRLELLVAASSSSSSSLISSVKDTACPQRMSQKEVALMPRKDKSNALERIHESQLSSAEDPSTSMTVYNKHDYRQPSASKPDPPTPQADPSPAKSTEPSPPTPQANPAPAKPTKQKTTGKENKADSSSSYYVGLGVGETVLEGNNLQDGSTFIIGLHKENEGAFITSLAPRRKVGSTKKK